MAVLLDFDSQSVRGDNHLFERIAQSLENTGFSLQIAGLPEPIAEALAKSLQHKRTEHFYRAGIGRNIQHEKDLSIRRDKICWIEPNDPDAKLWLEWAGQLQKYLNRRLFLGLSAFESHIAHYAPGDFYKMHVDAFRGESNRRLSLVTYLNEDWQPDQGGELVLYDSHGYKPLQVIQPAYRTMVIFLSEEFPHEVLPCQRDRYSVAGWFRVNGSVYSKVNCMAE